MFACPGACNTEFRQAKAAYEDSLAEWNQAALEWLDHPDGPAPKRPDPPDVQPVPGDPVFCGRCQANIRAKLIDLDELAAVVQAAIDGHRGTPPDRERVTGTPGHASPEPRIDAIDAVLRLVEYWEREHRKQMGFDPPPRRGRYVNRITGCLSWVSGHVDAILAHPDAGPQFAQDVLDAHRRLRELAHADAPERVLPQPCPRCDLKTMRVRSGDGHATCDNCGLVRAAADYEHRTVTR